VATLGNSRHCVDLLSFAAKPFRKECAKPLKS
jgi:hypothetical protein